MKKFLLLTLLCAACFISKAQTNIYHPFPTSNAHWNLFSVRHYGCTIWQNYQEWLSIHISGDTIIANTNYHKLEIPYLQKNCPQGGGIHFIGYQGAFREDTSLRQVFFVNHNDSSEQLLYDFNLSVGDTVKGFLGNQGVQGCSSTDVTVISMDSVLVGNSYRKRWQLSYFFIEIIEGIGSTRGLLDPVCEIIDGPEINLYCFSINDSVLYPSSTQVCDFISSIGANDRAAENRISISPNPFHTSARVEIKNSQSKINYAEIRIYNSMGVHVRFEKGISLDSYVLSRGSLPDGLYFYELSTLNYELVGSGKFIVE